MDSFVTSVWNFVAKPQILLHPQGYFIFRFQSIKNRDQILQAGPYTFKNKPMVLNKLWEVDFSFNQDGLSIIPLWDKIPEHPVEY